MVLTISVPGNKEGSVALLEDIISEINGEFLTNGDRRFLEGRAECFHKRFNGQESFNDYELNILTKIIEGVRHYRETMTVQYLLNGEFCTDKQVQSKISEILRAPPYNFSKNKAVQFEDKRTLISIFQQLENGRVLSAQQLYIVERGMKNKKYDEVKQ